MDTQANDIQRLNQIIDKNSKLIDDNSDELIQAKNNVGKYESSIENLIQTQGIFSKELSIYNRIMQLTTKLTKKDSKATRLDAKSKITLANATRRARIQMIKLNRTMKKNIYILIIATIISLVSAFAKTADGADKVKLGMSNLGSAVDILINRLGAFATYISTTWDRAIINIEISIERLKLKLLDLAEVDLQTDKYKKYSSFTIGILSILQEVTKMSLKTRKEIEGNISDAVLLTQEYIQSVRDQIPEYSTATPWSGGRRFFESTERLRPTEAELREQEESTVAA